MLDDLSYAGLKVNGKVGKPTIRPRQDLIWVGMRWLARLAQIKVPTEKLQSIRHGIGSMLQRVRKNMRVQRTPDLQIVGSHPVSIRGGASAAPVRTVHSTSPKTICTYVQELPGRCLLQPGVDSQPQMALQQHHALGWGQMVSTSHATTDHDHHRRPTVRVGSDPPHQGLPRSPRVGLLQPDGGTQMAERQGGARPESNSPSKLSGQHSCNGQRRRRS
jgi:hypothetical protein